MAFLFYLVKRLVVELKQFLFYRHDDAFYLIKQNGLFRPFLRHVFYSIKRFVVELKQKTRVLLGMPNTSLGPNYLIPLDR